MHKIEDKLMHVRSRIQEVARRANRNPDDITLLAVSKTQPADLIRRAYLVGQNHFGENYLQEASEKIYNLNDLQIHWHFIGPIQSNKAGPIAQNFSWVHSIDRLKIAQLLSRQRSNSKPALNVCIQINIDAESSKSGIAPEAAKDFALSLAKLPNIKLRGLMTIPASTPVSTNLNPFERLKNLFDQLKQDPELSHLDTLSMGMSDDMEQAIIAGATVVRVGTAIFGERKKAP